MRTGTFVEAGDILVGKVAPKSKSELTPEEKLLHAIFGKAGVDVKNASLTMPPGTRGVVIDAQKYSRRVNLTDAERTKALSVRFATPRRTSCALCGRTRTGDAQGGHEGPRRGHEVIDDLTGQAASPSTTRRPTTSCGA